MPLATRKALSRALESACKFCRARAPVIKSKGVLAALAIAALVRVAVFAITAYSPIVADGGAMVSPSLASGTDLSFYQDWRFAMFASIESEANAPARLRPDRRMTAGPLFPALLHLFEYGPENTWPLATVFLFGSVTLCWSWLYYLKQQGVSTIGLVAFSLMPHTIYYMICVGTELPFCVLFAVFFFSYFKTDNDRRYQFIWLAALLLLLLTRPNALSIVAFVLLDQATRLGMGFRSREPLVLAGLIVMAAIFGAVFQSYFVSVFTATSSKAFFGIPADRYLGGLLPALPSVLNYGISLTTLLLAKVLYFVGLRPSYSDVSMVYVLARALPGIPLLIGLGLLLGTGDRRHKQLVLLFMAPILLVGSQDRYSVPIQPLLILYFAKAADRLVATAASSNNRMPVLRQGAGGGAS